MLQKLKTKTLPADPQLAIVRNYFAEHGPALHTAAGLIKGVAGAASVLRLMSDLREVSRLDRSTRHKLVDLHRLLTLDPVGTEYGLEPSSCVLIPPFCRDVADLCLLADSFFDLLVEISEMDDARDAPALSIRTQIAA